jgi:hypothetical protein
MPAGIPENDLRSDGAGDKIAALVHDCDDSTGRVLVSRVSHRRSDYFFAPSKVRSFFCTVCAEPIEWHVRVINRASVLVVSFIVFLPMQ